MAIASLSLAASCQRRLLLRLANASRPIVFRQSFGQAGIGGRTMLATETKTTLIYRWSSRTTTGSATQGKTGNGRLSFNNIFSWYNNTFSWRNIAIATLRYGRIVVLIAGVYGLGYQRGIIDYASDPAYKEREMLQAVILRAGGGSVGADGRTPTKDEASPQGATTIARTVKDDATLLLGADEEMKRVFRTGRRIVRTARKLVDEKVKEHAAYVENASNRVAATTAQGKGTKKKEEEEEEDTGGKKARGLEGLVATVSEMEQYQFWCEAYQRINGHYPPEALVVKDNNTCGAASWWAEWASRPPPRLNSSSSSKRPKAWTYVLIHSSVPNAFVSELLPHYVFVTTAMLDMYVDNDDELGLVLGHELSHLVLGHSGQRTISEAVLRTVEVLLLSVDPTWGVATLGIVSLLGLIRSSIGAANSRRDEREADELGMKIAAMACYDTAAASHVFWKMMQSQQHGISSLSFFGRRKNQTNNDEQKGKKTVKSQSEEDKKQKDKGAGHTTRHILSFLESHPPTSERYEYLLELAKEENAGKYVETDCPSLKTAFYRAWRNAVSSV